MALWASMMHRFAAGVFSWCAQTTPLDMTRGGVVSVIVSAFRIVLASGEPPPPAMCQGRGACARGGTHGLHSAAPAEWPKGVWRGGGWGLARPVAAWTPTLHPLRWLCGLLGGQGVPQVDPPRGGMGRPGCPSVTALDGRMPVCHSVHSPPFVWTLRSTGTRPLWEHGTPQERRAPVMDTLICMY